VGGCRREYARLETANPRLAQYTAAANANVAAQPGAFFTASLQELIYYVLSLPPFDGWAGDPARRVRLARITALLESFASMPVPGYPNASPHGAVFERQQPIQETFLSRGVWASIIYFSDIFRAQD
jgi:hypothetical protein